MEVILTINFETETDIKLDFDAKSLVEKVIMEAMDYEDCPYEAEVNVLFTDDKSIHEINKEYREIDRPTDVLSFPMVEYDEPGDFEQIETEQPDCFHPDTGELLLGDIVISIERAIAQAQEYGHSVEREIAFLTAHSMFHLFGYDHMEEDMRLEMEQKQNEVLARLGINR